MIKFLPLCIVALILYVGVSCLTYKILRKTLFKEYHEIEGAEVCATFWILTVPFIVVFIAPFCLLVKLFEMIERGLK